MKTKTKLILFCVLFCLAGKGFSQAPNCQWAKGTHGIEYGDNAGLKIKVGASGNVYLLGFFTDDSLSFGSITIYKHAPAVGTQTNFYIAKYDASGNILLAKNLGKGSFGGFDFDLDASENFYVCGYYYQDSATIGTTTFYNPEWNPTYNTKIFIAKFDSDANPIWVKSNGSNGYYKALCLTVDTLQNLYFVGQYNTDTITFDSVTVIDTVQRNGIFFISLDPSGNLLFLKIIPTDIGVTPVDIVADDFGYLYLAGSFYCQNITFDFVTINNYHPPGFWSEIFMVKFENNGDVVWAKSQGGNSQNSDEAHCIGIDAFGNILVGGSYYPNSTFDTVTLMSKGNFLAQYNSNGNLNWIKTITQSNNSETIKGLGVDALGNEYIAGYFDSDTLFLDSDTLLNNHYPFPNTPQSLFFAKYDNFGNINWAKKAIGYGWAFDIYTTDPGDIYITGMYRWHPMTMDTVLLDSVTGYNTYTAKFGNSLTVGINEINNPQSTIEIYPNPTIGKFIIETTTNKISGIKIINVLGEIIFHSEITNPKSEINLSGMAKGIYFVEVETDKGRENRKIIVQ